MGLWELVSEGSVAPRAKRLGRPSPSSALKCPGCLSHCALVPALPRKELEKDLGKMGTEDGQESAPLWIGLKATLGTTAEACITETNHNLWVLGESQLKAKIDQAPTRQHVRFFHMLFSS